MSIDEKQMALVETFEFFDDWTDRYEHIISLGKELPPLSDEFKTEANLIKGCQSQVWLHAEMKDGKLFFSADSDAIITKGLISMIIQVFSGHSPEEIINTELSFIDRIGLKEHLSPTRSNGLLSMVKQLKFYAIAFSAKS
ncbi:MAG TPA: Fe-S metabolism protein SufE [Flavobacteriales bacterium]|nr:Fe-S metabolism protein SufE [Flavobacteriales bacterium]